MHHGRNYQWKQHLMRCWVVHLKKRPTADVTLISSQQLLSTQYKKRRDRNRTPFVCKLLEKASFHLAIPCQFSLVSQSNRVKKIKCLSIHKKIAWSTLTALKSCHIRNCVKRQYWNSRIYREVHVTCFDSISLIATSPPLFQRQAVSMTVDSIIRMHMNKIILYTEIKEIAYTAKYCLLPCLLPSVHSCKLIKVKCAVNHALK